MTGIYMIKNKINGNCYVGQSVDIYKRWMDHKTPSKRSKGLVLGRALSRYGCDNFEFIVLEKCDAKALNEREIHYISSLKPAYNMNEGGSGNSGHRLTSQQKKRLSRIASVQWESKTKEQRQAIIKNNLKGPSKGHPVSVETRSRLRESARKQFANGMPDETKKKISMATKGKKKNYIARPAPVEQIDKDTGIVIQTYRTTMEAAKATNTRASSITHVCRGRQITAGGYRWRYRKPK